MIVELAVAASCTSLSLMPPTPRSTKPTLTSGRSSFLQRVGQRLERALHVGLDDDVEGGRLAALDLLEDVLEATAAGHDARVAATGSLAVPALAGLGDRLGRLLLAGDDERVAGLGDVGETEHLRPAWRDRPP